MGRPLALLTAGVIAMAAGALPLPGCAEPAPVASRVGDETWARVTAGLDRFLDEVEALDEFPPGAAVVVVGGEGRRYIRVHGETKAGSGVPVTADSAFYIASMTKAFMGLLAARLDAEGVLPLETTLAAVWPGLDLPGDGRRADAVPLRDLLVHSIPFRVPELTFLEAYVRDVAPSEYPGLIERYGIARPDGYQYDNLGYNIYAAALEARTGRNWRDWLDERIFAPVGMTRTSGRASRYAADAIAWQHQRAGAVRDGWPRAAGWYLIPPKADGMMQSAGGLMTTANDMALWLEMQVAGRGPDGSGLTPAMLARARDDRVRQPASGNGFSCDAYAYGWNVCRLLIRGEADAAGDDRAIGPMFQHGGGYTGVRSLMTVTPHLGVAFLSNSDSMTGSLGQEMTKLVLELHEEVPGDDVRLERRLRAYRDANTRYLDQLQTTLQRARGEARWRGWAWTPDATTLAAFVGTYRRPGALLPEGAVRLEDSALMFVTGDRRLRLTPATPDLFGGQAGPYEPVAAFEFLRGPDGFVSGLRWNGDHYDRN